MTEWFEELESILLEESLTYGAHSWFLARPIQGKIKSPLVIIRKDSPFIGKVFWEIDTKTEQPAKCFYDVKLINFKVLKYYLNQYDSELENTRSHHTIFGIPPPQRQSNWTEEDDKKMKSLKNMSVLKNNKVEVEVTYTNLVNDRFQFIPSVMVTCSRCGHTTQSYGQKENSIKRCLFLLKKECPEGQSNYYYPME